ncbi:MAG: S8 family serine peptidase [Pseudomonadota bacterium]
MPRLALLCLSLAVSGCVALHLGGSVTRATLTIAPLATPDEVVETLVTPSVEEVRQNDGPERWDGREDAVKLTLLGYVAADESLYDDDTYYLAIASAGEDQDANSDKIIDETPAAVAGRWHAIIRGADLSRGTVTPLTDAIYRVLEPRLGDLSPQALQAELDAMARTMVADANSDGIVDYADVLGWHRHLIAETYLLDIAAVNELASAIRASATAVTLRELSFPVVGRDPSLDGAVFSVSGTISVPATSRVDSDLNNDFAPLIDNNSFIQAQPLEAPVVVGGYANLAGQGEFGATRFSGDESDFYRVTLTEDDRITLVIADTPENNDFDLYLYNASQELVDASVSTNQESAFEQLRAPADGDYFVEVRVFSGSSLGASNYLLTLGIDSLPANTPLRRVSDDFVPGEMLAKFRSVGAADSKARRERISGMRFGGGGRNSTNRLQMRNRLAGLTLAQRKLRTLLALKRLERTPEVLQAGLNYHVYPTAITPGDQFYGFQAWQYEQISLPDAWEISQGNNTVVAVIDTGIRRNHPDLVGKLVAGYDFFDEDANPEDPGDAEDPADSSSFHGTHVAGTVGANTDNSLGVAGAGWNAQIMPLRVLGPGGGTTFDVLRAVRFAAGIPDSFDSSIPTPQRPADVINLSLAGGGFDGFAQDLFNQVAGLGIVVVAAAGNDSSSDFAYPASYDNVISVSATNINRTRASYSNFGSAVDVAAPGGDSVTNDTNGDGQPDLVLSTGADDSDGSAEDVYTFLQGTSMAAPHVAGVIALMKSVYPQLTTDTVEALLAQSFITDDLGTPGRDNIFGWGLINARKAVEVAQSLANGEDLELMPDLNTSAATLNFGAFANQLELTLSNSGPGTLVIDAITASESWLSVSAIAVDANGVGSYSVNVDRSQLGVGTFLAELVISSNDQTASVQVVLEQPDPTVFTQGNAGPHYVLLVDSDSGEVVQEDAVVASEGRYEYLFTDVPAGRYQIIGGSDADNDFFICDPGESCGAWPALDDNLPIIDVTGDLSGLDFSSSYSTGVVSIESRQTAAPFRLPAQRRSAYVRPDSAPAAPKARSSELTSGGNILK